MKTFEKQISVHFRQTDMAGIAYFNEVFNLFHDVYELWVESFYQSQQKWFNNQDWAVPLKSVHCDYHQPLFPFETYTVRVSLDNVGSSTFRLKTEILKELTLCAEISTTHIFVNKKSKNSQPIPTDIFNSFKNF